MNIQNIASLTETLQSLGFEKGLEYKLLRRICFQPSSFYIQQRIIKGKDIMNFSLFFERYNNEDYTCMHYDAVLRKEINITATSVHGALVKDLEKMMQEIDWSVDFEQEVRTAHRIEDKENWSREEKIERIVTMLLNMASDEEGAYTADCLRFKYWCDTAVQDMINNIGILKSRYEISQRFYLFNNGSCISAEEAYRFLNNRWMEKSLQVKKKQVDNKENESSSSVIGRAVTDKNLLQKKRGSKARKLKVQ
ncbi:MAG TPA: hypothetical protein PLP23_17050 [Panacibacter sp.]|nr:hypothetical protein [Panacibacter sp.]